MQLQHITLIKSLYLGETEKVGWAFTQKCVLKSYDPIFPLWLSALSSHLPHLHPSFSKVSEPLLCARNCPGLG